MSGIDIYASISTLIPKDSKTYVSVKVTNPLNKNTITIPMLADSGADYSVIGWQDGSKLVTKSEWIKGDGPNISGTTAGIRTNFRHQLDLQIGNLKPIRVPVSITEEPTNKHKLGWHGVLDKLNLEVTKTHVTYTEPPFNYNNTQKFFPFKFVRGHPNLTMDITNTDTNKTVKAVDMMVDTGATFALLDTKLDRTLGTSTNSCHVVDMTLVSDKYTIRPVRGLVCSLNHKATIKNVVGINAMQQFGKFTINKAGAIIGNASTPVSAAFAQSFTGARYRNRI